MIQKNELRIGNWIYIGELIGQVNGDSFNTTIEFDPIPLTSEILEKCGFSKKGTIQLTRRIILDWSFGSEFWLSDADNGDDTLFTFDNITSLHQLQNLYFSLTGKELSVTL